MAFKDFPGQAQGVMLLQRSLQRGRLGHGYLFFGQQLDELEALARTLAKLFETVEAVLAAKVEVVPAGRKYSELLAATGGRLHVSGGWAVMQMIEALDRGVHAFMPTALHALYVRIYQFHTAGQRQAARDLFDQVLPILAFSNQHLDISIHFFKRLLFAQGIYPTPNVRQPILPFDEVHARIAREFIARAEVLESTGQGGRSEATTLYGGGPLK